MTDPRSAPRVSEPLTVEAWQQHLLEGFVPLETETVPVEHAAGRTLAAEVRSQIPIPSFDNSSMDGYAVRARDVASASADDPAIVTIVADVPAGSSLDPSLPTGTGARIMTGAPVPSEADTVIPVEDTAEYFGDERWVVPDTPGARIHVTRAPATAQYVRIRGEDLLADQTVLTAGVLLTSRAMASIAATGHSEVHVTRRPRAVVISTGSELVAPGTPTTRGTIPDSNTALVSGLSVESGAMLVDQHVVSDSADALMALLNAIGPADVDLIILTGGVSVGAFDVVKVALESEPDVAFRTIAMQPGKPQGFGHLSSGVPVFCLPGNPVSVAVSFELFVRPAILRMLGRTAIQRPHHRAVAAADWQSPPARRQYIPVIVDTGATPYPVRPSAQGGSGSHLVGSLAAATGYAIVPAETTSVTVGDELQVIILD